MSTTMNNLVQRAITGAVFVAVMVCACLSPWSLAALSLVINVACLLEYFRLKAMPVRFQWGFAASSLCLQLGYFLATLGGYLGVAGSLGGLLAILGGLSILILSVWILVTDRALFPYGAVGILYCTVPSLLLFVNGFGHLKGSMPGTMMEGFNPAYMLTTLVLIWTNDTFAYLIGRQIGKTPLAPTISPKKTWEGTVGGWLVCIGMAFFLDAEVWPMDVFPLGLGLLVGIMAVLGDLYESSLKRKAGVKDSGTMLPGHGGFLDRFDAMLWALPAVVIFRWVTGSL